MNIISVSRRTDIPAWYGAWFMNRVRAGSAIYKNPFGGRHHEVSLCPEDVIAFIFWTKNPSPFLPDMRELLAMGYKAYFQYTITGYGAPVEPGVPPWPKAVKTFKATADLLGPSLVRWRYDPILIAPGFDRSFHLQNFARLSARLEGFTDTCHVSFVQFYRKTQRNLENLDNRTGIRFEDPGGEDKIRLASELHGMAASKNIRLVSCCYPLLGQAGVEAGSCIDAGLIQNLRPDLEGRGLKPGPTRKGCHCVQSRDIGAYDTCLGACVYCYATQNPSAARKRFDAHDPEGPALA